MEKFESAYAGHSHAEREAALKSEVIAAREATRVKAELVATVSHELRTPLASVLGFAELLLCQDLDADTRARYTHTIHDEAQRLAALIDDFLDLEKIEAGRFTLALEPFDLVGLLQHQAKLFSAQSEHHSIELTVPEAQLRIVGDRKRVGQVMANLLSNAIKYSPHGGVVGVKAISSEGFVRIEVSDTGLGIPSEQQAQVFTKFFRADSSDTREIGGTGLGLALCHEIVEAHGGHIGFESLGGVGSTFWFELPGAWNTSPTIRGERVLIIATETSAARLAQHLVLDGLEVDVAGTGAFGLERAQVLSPAVICLDIDLPGDLDGWQVMVRLQADHATAHCPVIVCDGERGRSTATTLGAACFLPKPFTPEQLREAVTRQLSEERSRVLVVGDDEMLRRLVIETLARAGGDLREAADGLEAIAMIAARQPDVLVLDLPNPGPNGFAEIKQLLEHPEARGLPVIVLSGRALSVSEKRFLKERSVSLIQKSEYSGDQLRRLIHHAPSTFQEHAALVPRAADPQ